MKGSIRHTHFENINILCEITDARVDWSYDAGCVSGPPEHCYPPESEEEVQVEEALVGLDDNGEGGILLSRSMTPDEALKAVRDLLDMLAEQESVQEEAQVLAGEDASESYDPQEDYDEGY